MQTGKPGSLNEKQWYGVQGVAPKKHGSDTLVDDRASMNEHAISGTGKGVPNYRDAFAGGRSCSLDEKALAVCLSSQKPRTGMYVKN